MGGGEPEIVIIKKDLGWGIETEIAVFRSETKQVFFISYISPRRNSIKKIKSWCELHLQYVVCGIAIVSSRAYCVHATALKRYHNTPATANQTEFFLFAKKSVLECKAMSIHLIRLPPLF